MKSLILAAVIIIAATTSARAADNCFNSGVEGGYAFCVSDYGQITQINRPYLVNHVQQDGIREGFNVCKGDDFLNARAYGADDQDGFIDGPVKVQPNGPGTLPLTITLMMYDGVEVRQTFAWSKSDRELRITMRVRNTTATKIPLVRVSRQLDFRMAGTGSADRGGVSQETAFAWKNGVGLSIGADSLMVDHAVALSSPDAVDRFECGSSGDEGETATGDLVGRVTYNFGTLFPKSYHTAAFVYRLF